MHRSISNPSCLGIWHYHIDDGASISRGSRRVDSRSISHFVHLVLTFRLISEHLRHTARVIAAQAGLTAFRYGNLEVRTVYQYYSHHTPTFITDQNSLYLNPRWNNFIDILDFPKDKPINRMIRHILFGPLEDRAVPYLGALVGGTIPGRDANSPGYLYGGQVGVRFPVARGFSVDMGLQYTRFEIDFKGKSDLSEQWLFTTGIRF